MGTRTRLVALLAAAGLTLAACGGAATASSGTATTTTTGSEAPTTIATTTTPTTTTDGSVTTVSANDATEAEIAAALEAAGVSNAARWAKEVVEYRPYDATDSDLTQLRDELAKYNPGEGVVDLIVSALRP